MPALHVADPEIHPQTRRNIFGERTLLSLTLAFIVLRVCFVFGMNLIHEEAYYWLYAQHPALGYLDHPPMVAWLISLGSFFFGHNEFAVRAGTLACGGATLYYSHRLCRELFGASAARCCALLVAALPFCFTTGLLATPDAPLTAAWAACLYYLKKCLLDGESKSWFAAGAALGLGLLSKYTMGLIVLPVAVFMIVDAPSRRWWRGPHLYLAVLLAVFIFSPVIYWNATHDWASFGFQTTRRVSQKFDFNLHMLALSALALTTPAVLWAAVGLLRPIFAARSDSAPRDPAQSRVSRWTAVFTLAPLSVFVFFSLAHAVKFNWTGPIWLALLPAVAARLAGGVPGPAGDAARAWAAPGLRAWRGNFAALLLLYFSAFIILSAPVRLSNKFDLPSVWDRLGRAVEDVETKLEKDTGKECLIAGADKNRISSELAFYDPNQQEGTHEFTGRHLWGKDSLAFEYWMPARDAAGQNVIIVASDNDTDGLSKDGIKQRFRTMGPIETIELKSMLGETGRFHYRIGYEYRPTGQKP